MKRGNASIDTNLTELKEYEQLYANKSDNLGKMNKFLGRYK